MPELRLVPVSGPPIDVVKDPTVVGRDPSCEIVVTDGSVSRRHARLETRDREWWVVDQGSANGTYLNSMRIAEQALQTGHELRFGALAYRVELAGDSDATVSTPVLDDDSATLLAPSASAAAAAAVAAPPPPPVVVAAPPPPPMAPPPVPRAAATPPPVPPRPSAPPPPAGMAERARPAGAPVPQMPGGSRAAKKGRSPLFWVGIGCCGCLLLVAILAGVIGGGVYMATKPVAAATQSWLSEVRANNTEAAVAGLSSGYRDRLTQEEMQTIATAIQGSTDASFPSRSIENDRAVVKGVLTGGPAPQPITVTLVKEEGVWKIDNVELGIQ